MISKQEILELAGALSIRPDVVEKDFVLGWLLASISNHPEINKTWVFKGGTCLKKCYFETFRFSEDLDFTITDANQIDEAFLRSVLKDIAAWVSSETGIVCPADQVSIEMVRNNRNGITVQGKIGFIGPLGRKGNVPKVKFDLTADEILVHEPVVNDMFHQFSDKPETGIKALCYSYEELFAEKIRALTERARPRDLYDVIHLYHNRDNLSSVESVRDVLKQKCAFKRIEPPSIDSIVNHEKIAELEAEWAHMLKHQIAVLPALHHYLDELDVFFNWLYEIKPIPVLPEAATQPSEQRWLPGRVRIRDVRDVIISTIQFAAANRLCLEMKFKGIKRIVEPYSFRITKERNILFYGFDVEKNAIRSYSLVRIESVDVLNRPFKPRFKIEISSSGRMNIQPTRKRQKRV